MTIAELVAVAAAALPTEIFAGDIVAHLACTVDEQTVHLVQSVTEQALQAVRRFCNRDHSFPATCRWLCPHFLRQIPRQRARARHRSRGTLL